MPIVTGRLPLPVQLPFVTVAVTDAPVLKTNPDGTPVFRFASEQAKLTRVLCWLTGQDDLAGALTPGNWEEVYSCWKQWNGENGLFAVFDPEQDRYVVDAEAKAAGQPIPRARQLAPPAETPFPNWRGPIPF